MPKRIQRKRAKGWRMPANTIYVGRPTIWGNYCIGVNLSDSVHLFNQFAINKSKKFPDWLKLLKGKNLACWCPDHWPCHAYILLQLANQE